MNLYSKQLIKSCLFSKVSKLHKAILLKNLSNSFLHGSSSLNPIIATKKKSFNKHYLLNLLNHSNKLTHIQ